MSEKSIDCIIIGYNEAPFDSYEQMLAKYGADSEAYRDLQFSFVNVDGKKLTYVDLLNHVFALADTTHSLPAEVFKSADIPSLAAAYLTHFLIRDGHRARYINLFQYEKEKLAQYLAEDPYCVAITTTFYVMNFPVNEMVDFIRQHNKQVKIIVGGPLIANHHRRYHGQEFATTLDDIGADIYVVESQGELTLSRIVQALKQGGDVSEVPNIVYSVDGTYRVNPREPENNSIDENFVDWRTFAGENLGATIQTRTARSCAFSCAFCAYPMRSGALTLAGLDTIERELDTIHELGDVRNVVFIDDTFNVPLKRFKDICRLMIRKNYQYNWFSYFRCSNSDAEAIELMAESGCKGVFLGVESGSPTILKNMHKAATIEKYAEGIKLLHQYNILTFGSFIVGFPGETNATVQETIDFIKEHRPDYYRAQLWYCEPGTPIDSQRLEYGINGQGFVWNHATMDSFEAMNHIERLFLSIDESIWLPQWSFDFWIIPYLLGMGISLDQFRELMALAHKLLALEIAFVPESEKQMRQDEYLQRMVQKARDCSLPSLEVAHR